MQTNKTIRQVKLHSKFRYTQRGWTKGDSTGQVVPWLNVNGRWLQQAGFQAGDRIEISVSNRQLIIKKVPEHGTHRA